MRLNLCCSGNLILWLAAAGSVLADGPREGKIDFNRDVRPILSDNCFACHGFDEHSREADLRLDVAEGAIESGVIVPGEPDESELVARITATDDSVMPPPDSGKHLTASQRETLRQWIEQGAVYATHWAFQAPQRPALPQTTVAPHPIDRFIQARLAEERLTPSPAESPEKLLRRVCLDLTGLPPTVEQIEAFAAATAADPDAAYEQLVDRLLSSPHYGERWGRWWLDQARYADSNGYSIDAPREIWKFRDWVVAALNADLPFDQFTIEQLAGDLLPDAAQDQKVATGFHRNTQINQEGGIDKEQFRVDSVFDRVATTGTVWLGLTVGCAQCHDHKFDPIEQKEFYRLFAFLNNQDEPTMKVFPPGVDGQAVSQELKQVQAALGKLFRERSEELSAWEAGLTQEARQQLSPAVIKALEQPQEKRNFDHQRVLFAAALGDSDEFQRLDSRRGELQQVMDSAVTTMVLSERATPRTTTVFVQGDFTRPAEEVTPGTPAILHDLYASDERATRLDLARWIVSRRNPLTARVLMNRVWQQYFGRGIVETENDFGLQGSPPSHPELLDWLAVEFMRRDWSLKAMHRLIVTSHTYRQSARDRAELREKDPDNYLLARQQRLRLDAEVVRDVGLASSGLLVPKLGGPPVFPPIPEGVMSQGQVNRAWKASQGADRYRRGLYTFIYRATPPPSLNVFDAPEGVSTCTRRVRSNTPLQALTLMNDHGFFEFAQALQAIIQRDGLTNAFRRCTGRTPSDEELAVLQKLDTLSAARVLLNLDETITRD